MIPGITASMKRPSAGIAWNPADKGSAVILAENDLWAYKTTTTTNTYHVARVAAPKSSGKWYFEALSTAGGIKGIGLASLTMPLEYTNIALPGNNYCFYFNNAGIWYNNGNYYGSSNTYATGHVIGVAFDADAGTVAFYRNGILVAGPVNLGTGKTYTPAVMLRDFDNGPGGPLGYKLKPTPQYAPPAGYSAWTP